MGTDTYWTYIQYSGVITFGLTIFTQIASQVLSIEVNFWLIDWGKETTIDSFTGDEISYRRSFHWLNDYGGMQMASTMIPCLQPQALLPCSSTLCTFFLTCTTSDPEQATLHRSYWMAVLRLCPGIRTLSLTSFLFTRQEALGSFCQDILPNCCRALSSLEIIRCQFLYNEVLQCLCSYCTCSYCTSSLSSLQIDIDYALGEEGMKQWLTKMKSITSFIMHHHLRDLPYRLSSLLCSAISPVLHHNEEADDDEEETTATVTGAIEDGDVIVVSEFSKQLNSLTIHDFALATSSLSPYLSMKKYEMLFYSFVNLADLTISDYYTLFSMNSLSHPTILTLLFNGRSATTAITTTHEEQEDEEEERKALSSPILLPNLINFLFSSHPSHWRNSCLRSNNVPIDDEEEAPLFSSWKFITMPKVTCIYLQHMSEFPLITCKRMIKQYRHLNELYVSNANNGKVFSCEYSGSSCITLEERYAALKKSVY